MAAMSLVGQVLPFLLFGVAAHLTTSADMALMMGGVPIFTFVIARLFALGEVWNARAAFGLALGLVGVAVSLASPLGSAAVATASEPGLGRALALLGASGYATGALLSRPVSREIGAAMAATGSMAVSAGLLLVLVLALDGLPSPAALAATPLGPLAALCALGLFNTALAYFIYFRLIASAGATFAALNNYIVPCFGLLAGAWALGEPVGPSSWIGMACVLGGVVVTGSAANASRVIAKR
jgi:drug/metabolite transporter (DMT)-like permease